MFTLVLLACAAEPFPERAPRFEVVNKTAPAFVVVNRIPAVANPDPYGFKEYRDFYREVAAGTRGILVVGIKDRWVGSYQAHCRVPSGFGGLRDGEYECWSENGKMLLRSAPAPEVTGRPFSVGATNCSALG